MGVVHRDIKASNIFIGHNDRLVLGDFGLADFVKPGDEIADYTSKEKCGTTTHMAPEVILGTGYNYLVDYWSATCVLYYMLTGRVRLSKSFRGT
jgi:serine/threonine protein kinase